MKDALALEKRRKIYRYIEKHPGVYMREIQKALGLGTGVLEYHLDFLVKRGLLTTYEDGRKRRYYSAEKVSAPQKKLLSFLRQKRSRRILTLSLRDRGISVDELMKECNISRSTATSQISKLVEAGYLKKSGNSYFSSNPEELTDMLITYRESYLDDVVDRFLDSFERL